MSAAPTPKTRRDDVDGYTVPQDCQTQCAGVTAARDSCRQGDKECSVCTVSFLYTRVLVMVYVSVG